MNSLDRIINTNQKANNLVGDYMNKRGRENSTSVSFVKLEMPIAEAMDFNRLKKRRNVLIKKLETKQNASDVS